MKDTPGGFQFTEEGAINAYLGVDIYPLTDRKIFTLSQPFLIDQIIQAFGSYPKTTKGATNNTSAGYPLLNKDENGPARKESWKYRGIIGMLGYLQGTTRPGIAMSTHQRARSNNNPHLSHEIVVNRIVRYLLDTRDKVVIYKPDTSQGLECYVDADFVVGWKYGDQNSQESVLSLTGFFIMYYGFSIHWGGKIQTEISLSTTESEYIDLSTSMREQITFMSLMKETSGLFGLLTIDPLFRCTVFKDN